MLKKAALLVLVIAGAFVLTGCKSDDTLANLEAALAEISVDAEVTEDLTLPTTGANDVVIEWASDSPDVIAADGTVTRPSDEDGDATVVLTATLTLGEEELSHDFTVTVLALEPVDPMDALLDGFFVFSFYAEGYGSYTSFFHFYEDDPVLGAVFYYGGSNNSSNFAGTYTIEELDIEWAAYPDRETKVNDTSEDNADISTGTAPYTITFYDFEGNEIDQAGYDGEFIYNDMEDGRLAASGAGESFYLHDTDGDGSDLADIYAGELGIPYVSLVDPSDEAATLNINHNRTYADLVGEFIVEGTWSVADGADGALVFTLTPTESYDTGAEVVLNADQTAATYTPDGSTAATDLEVPVEEVPVDGRVVLFEWNAESTDRTFTFYVDGTWEFNYDEGTVIEVGTFTYTGYAISITQSDGTVIDGSMDGTTHALSIPYASVAGDGALTETFTVESSVWGAAFGGDGEYEPPVLGPEVLFEWSSDSDTKTLTFYENGWYKFEYTSYEIVEYGTFEIKYGTITLTQSDGTEIVGVRDGTTNEQSLSYVAEASDQITQDFTAELATWSAVTDAQGTYAAVHDNDFVLFVWSSDSDTKILTFYVTGVYKFEYTSYEIVEYGMFDITYGTITLTQSDDNVITGVRDGTTNLQSLSYIAVASAQITQDFTAELATWSAVTDAQGSYSPRFTEEE